MCCVLPFTRKAISSSTSTGEFSSSGSICARTNRNRLSPPRTRISRISSRSFSPSILMWKCLPSCILTCAICRAFLLGLYIITCCVDVPIAVNTVSNSTVSCEKRSCKAGSSDTISCWHAIIQSDMNTMNSFLIWIRNE